MARDAKLNAYLELRAETKGMASAMKRAQRELDTLSQRVTNLQKRQSRLNRTMRRFGGSLAARVTGLVAFGAAMHQAAAAAIEFNTNLTKVQYLVGVSADSIDKFRSGLIKMAAETGRPIQELAEGLYDVTSAGFRGGEAMDVLRAAADGAVLGLGTTKTLADAATNALGAWGRENLDATTTMATLWAGVREGKAPAEAFARLVSDVGSLSAQLGIELDQVVGAFAHLTKSMDEATARTRIKGILNALLKPSEQAVSVMQKYGLTVKDVAKEVEHDLLGALNMIERTLDKGDLARLFRNTEGLAGFLALTGRNAGSAAATAGGVSGTTVADFDTARAGASGSIQNQLNQELAFMKTQMTVLAETALPPLIDILGVFADTVGVAALALNALIDLFPERDRALIRGPANRGEGVVVEGGTLDAIELKTRPTAVARNPFDTRYTHIDPFAGLKGGRIEQFGTGRLRDLSSTTSEVDARSAEIHARRLAMILGERDTPLTTAWKKHQDELARARDREAQHQTAVAQAGATGTFEGGEFDRSLLADLQQRVELRKREAQAASATTAEDVRANLVARTRQEIERETADIQNEIRRAKFDIANAATDEERYAAQEMLAGLESQLAAIQKINLESPEYRDLFDQYTRWSKEIGDAAKAQRELQEQIQRTERLVDFGKGAAEEMFLAFTEGTMSAKDAFKRFAADVIRELYRIIVVQQTVNALAAALGFGGGVSSGGPVAAGSATPGQVGFQQGGGLALAGQPYVVGERNAELFVPQTSGRIERHTEAAKGDTVYNFYIESTDGPGVERALQTALPDFLEAARTDTANHLVRSGEIRRLVTGG